MQMTHRLWTILMCAAGGVAATALFLSASGRASAETQGTEAMLRDIWVECGTEIPVRPVVEAGTVIVVKQWTNAPEGSHDEEIADLLANPDKLMLPFALALLAHLKDAGQFYDVSCGPCENPNRCFIWITSWDEGGEWIYNVVESGDQIWIEAEILTTFSVTGSCTDC